VINTIQKLKGLFMWYVYVLYDPRNNKPFYVGKGKKYRLSATINVSQTGNALKRKFLSEIKDMGLEPRIEIIAEYDEEIDAFTLEKELVSKYGRIIKGDGILTNYSEGGDSSNAGWVPSEETRKIWSAQRSGAKQTTAHIQKRVKKNSGQRRTGLQKRNCVLASIRKTNPELKVKIIKALEAEAYSHGMYRVLAEKFNCHHELISRIHKDIVLYKEALNEWFKK
jgi:hypothetical protein